MKKLQNSYFDVCDFTYRDNCRVLILDKCGERIEISGSSVENIGDLEFWLIPEKPVQCLFGEFYHQSYVRFFGKLLSEIYKCQSAVPIRGISLNDVAHASENDKQAELAHAIASGLYVPERGDWES